MRMRVAGRSRFVIALLAGLAAAAYQSPRAECVKETVKATALSGLAWK